jgi:hypothetical protein
MNESSPHRLRRRPSRQRFPAVDDDTRAGELAGSPSSSLFLAKLEGRARLERETREIELVVRQSTARQRLRSRAVVASAKSPA